jgi:hypothetical protein
MSPQDRIRGIAWRGCLSMAAHLVTYCHSEGVEEKSLKTME